MMRSRGHCRLIADLQVVPTPSGTIDEEFAHVNAAIRAISRSGLTHTVHSLGTQIEGEADAVWSTLRAAFDAAMESGASKELMYIKVYQGQHTVASLEASGTAVAAGAERERKSAQLQRSVLLIGATAALFAALHVWGRRRRRPELDEAAEA